MIKLRKDQLQDEGELENIKKKRRVDFLDILLFARVSMFSKVLRVFLGTHKGTSIALTMPFAPLRWRMGTACLTRTYVLRWTHSCSRAMTPQPVESPGSSMLWPTEMQRGSSEPPGGWILYHLVRVQEVEVPLFFGLGGAPGLQST